MVSYRAGPTAQTIHSWVKQADLDTGVRSDGLTSSEREELRGLRRENKRLRIEREILKKSRGLVRSGDRLRASEAFEFVRANQAEFSVRMMCEVLVVSTSGYYAWKHRPPSAQVVDNDRLLRRMREIHRFSRETYGQPRMHAELRDDGWRVNHKRVRRLMRRAGLRLLTIGSPSSSTPSDLTVSRFSTVGSVAERTNTSRWRIRELDVGLIDSFQKSEQSRARALRLPSELAPLPEAREISQSRHASV